MRERQPCVYMMASGFYGRLYVGVTSNLIGRVMDAAVAAEKRIKKWRRDWKIGLIEDRNPTWNDLAVSLGLDPLP